MAEADWREELDGWLAPFLAVLGHEKRRRWAPFYLHGLLGPGERKSLQPLGDPARPGWPRPAPALRRQPGLGRRAPAAGPGREGGRARRRAGRGAGRRRHRAARSRAGARSAWPGSTAGPRASAPTARSWSRSPWPGARCRCRLGLRLFLPEAWAPTRTAAPAPACRTSTGGPWRRPRSRSRRSTACIAAGARFGRVVADAGYGISAAFRQGLSERGLVWAVGVPKVQNVYPTTVELRWPVARTGRPRKHPVPSEEPGRGRGRAGERRVAPDQLAARAPRGRSRPSSPPCGCARPRARSSATAGTCPGTRSGWWASAAPRASGSTTSPTCRPTRRSRSWRRRSRPAGSASRRTSSSRRSWASTTSRAAPGPACTGTR